jgi:hypothetical protein
MKSLLRTEDGWAVLLGLTLLALAGLGLAGADPFGWVVKTNVWSDPTRAMAPASQAYAALPGALCLLLTSAIE